jgi:arylsulfatase A-like enzyme
MKLANEFFNIQPVPNARQKRRLWLRLSLLSVWVVYFYVFMEWLFFATKPSFMDVMGMGQKIEVFFFTGLFLIVLILPAVIILFGLAHLPGLSGKWLWFLFAGVLIPAVVLAATSLLMADNFTYTLFHFGVASSRGFFRLLYGALFLLVAAFWYRWAIRYLKSSLASTGNSLSLTVQSILTLGIILISSALAVSKMNLTTGMEGEGEAGGNVKRPNILLLGGDGINADNMSLYGYERDTTPNLRVFAQASLVAENAFTNSANSPGSITSILTGKLPMNTRVIYPPDILRDSDSYQHLPGILRGMGYRNIEMGVSYYIDAYTLNIRDGFDEVNLRSVDQAGFQTFAQTFARSTGLQDAAYFLSALTERLSDRALHIFFIQEMDNPYLEVNATRSHTPDNKKVRKLVNYLKQAEQPLFIHVHLMGTHGPRFEPGKRVFSAGETQDADWMPDFYDDAVLEWDDYVGKVWSELTKMDLLDDTIVIIYSDHPEKWKGTYRIPLIIRFPEGQYAGKIRNNVQNLDIAPTILDYMGLPIPDWMEGQSLLAGEPDPTRRIFVTGATHISEEDGYFAINVQRAKPPFYQFGYLDEIVCQKWYRVILNDYEWTQGEVDQHTAPCERNALPDAETAQEEILQRLESDGFEVSSLQRFFATVGSNKLNQPTN